MIDHYVLNPGEDFYQRFKVLNRLPAFPKNSDVSPGQIEPIITHQEGLTLVWVMKWGLIPFWAKERGVGDRMFNLKTESLLNNQAFRKSLKTQRCLIPANGFYISSLYYQIEDRPLFSFAGVYDIWEEPVSGHEVYTYSIVTTDSQMPVILHQEQESIWLDSSTSIIKINSLLRSTSEKLTISK